MAFAETANLAVKLTLGGNFTSQLKKATGSLKGFEKDSGRAYKAGAQIGTGIKRGAVLAAAGVGVLVSQVGFGLDQLVELESLTAQTNAVIKSTKGAAGQTADSIRNLAESYESLNAQVDDKAIQNAENVLLTFTKVGKAAFKPALEASLDLSTALHKDLQGSIILVGKALQDPIKGMTALGRAGVDVTELKGKIADVFKFSKDELAHIKGLNKEQQKKYIADLRAIKTARAQKLILAELNKEFGGSFLAGGQTTAGKVAKFGDAIEDLQKSLAVALLPTVGNVADALNELLRDPATIKATEELGRQIGSLFSKDNIKKGIDALREGFGFLRSIAGPIAEILGTAVKAFTSLPPDIQKLLVGGFAVNKLTGGLITNVFGGIAEAIAHSFIKAPLVNVQGGVVNVGGGVGGGGGGLLGTAAGAAGIGSLTALSLIAASAAGTVIATLPFLEKNNVLGSAGLSPQEIADRKFNSGSQADQQVAIKHGFGPTGTSRNNLSPQVASDLKEAAQQLRNAAPQRAAAADLSESASQLRNIERTPPIVKIKEGNVSTSTTTKVSVSVTAGGIKRSVTMQTRHGRTSGSRVDDRHAGYSPGGV